MRLNIFIIVLFYLTSCVQEKKSKSENDHSSKEIRDTILVRHQNALTASYEVGLYSKSYSYYWLAGKDTLDLFINATEYEKDRTFHINIHHKKPMLFKVLLDSINKCIPLIKKDFDITRFSSIYFESPIYYLDLVKELSREYEQKFGRKNISYQKLNGFLLTSTLNTQINSFLNPFDKKVERYSIEKFQLMDKKYFSDYLPNTDIKDYPEFAIEGMGVSVQLKNK